MSDIVPAPTFSATFPALAPTDPATPGLWNDPFTKLLGNDVVLKQGLTDLQTTGTALQASGMVGLNGTVPDPASLPATVVSGQSYQVLSTATVWSAVGGVWADSGVPISGAPQASSLLTQAILDMSVATPGAYTRLVRRLATTTDTVTVLLIGDSITEGADQVGYGTEDTYAVRLVRWLEQHFAGRVQVVNRALGQRSIDTFANTNFKAQASEPTDITTGFGPRTVGDRPWATADIGKSWQQITKEVGADLVLLAFGMNQNITELDSNYLQRTTLNSVLDNIATTWTTWQGLAPDVLLVTPMMPIASYGRNPTQMRGMASMQRGVARLRGLPVADVNRLSNLGLYGIDPESRASREWITIAANLTDWTDTGVASWVRQSDGTYTRAAAGSAGYMQCDRARFMDGEVRVFAAFSADNQMLNLVVRTGAWGQLRVQWTGSTVQVFELPQAGGASRTLGGRTWAATLAAGGTWSGAGQSLYLWAEGPRLRLTHNGVDVPLQDSALGLAPTTVQIGTQDSGYVLPSRLLGLEIIPRAPIQSAGPYTGLTLLGAAGASGGAGSGNHLNHPTGTGHALLYHAAVSAALSSVPPRVAALAATGTESIGTPTYSANWGDLTGYVPARVTQSGHRVEMAGNSQRSAGAGTTALTVPVGFRPPTSYLVRVNTSAGMLTATVQANGQIIFTDALPDNGWVAWSGVEWLIP